MDLIIQLIAGALAGNAGGAWRKSLSLGLIGNSLAGALGGALGGSILNAALGAVGDVGTVAATAGVSGDLAAGALGGVLHMLAVGLVKRHSRQSDRPSGRRRLARQ